jgi:NitT/TauT family transport system substrate-binding protein
MLKTIALTIAVAVPTLLAQAAAGADLVRLGNLKFAHFGAVSYMKEIAGKYDLKIEERVFPKGIDILPAIVAGEIDVAASGVDAAIAGRASGVPIYIVAGFAKGGARIVARPDAGIRSIADLKGKKVATPRGGAQELLLFAEFAKHGLSWSDRPGKDVHVIYMGFPDMNQALAAGNIDAMSQSEPQSSQAINKGFGVEVIKPYDTELGEPSRSLFITESLYKTKPEVAERLMRCFVEATATFIAKPELAEAYVKDKMFKGQITSQDYRDAIGNSPFSYDITVEHVQVTTDLMQRYGVGRMETPPKAADWVRLDLLAKAKAALQVN